jgi:hypothetical protein
MRFVLSSSRGPRPVVSAVGAQPWRDGALTLSSGVRLKTFATFCHEILRTAPRFAIAGCDAVQFASRSGGRQQCAPFGFGLGGGCSIP